jgi:D-methionine transport system substrate-binding protein
LKFLNTQLAPQERLEVKIITFNVQIRPNTALRGKASDANFFQHRPFMNNAIKELTINLVPLNLVSLSTLGLLSKSLKSVEEPKYFELLMMYTSLFLRLRLLL